MNSPYFKNLDDAEIPAVPLMDQGETSMGGNSGNASAGNMPMAPLPNPANGSTAVPGNGGANVPMAPLPNIGEGRPIPPVNNGSNIPMAPLPEIGGGRPIPPVNNGSNIPMAPLPEIGGGRPIPPINNGSNIPMAPLPEIGVGRPVATGPFFSVITTFPRPDIPCFFCGTGRTGRVRFLNATTGYNPFLVYINNQLVVERLSEAEISSYGRVTSGFQTITVTSMNGYVYIQKSMNINADSTSTIAIINTAGGIDLTQIADVDCNTSFSTACFRACNLSYNSGALDVILNNGYVMFSDIRYKEVTPFSRLQSGEYQINVARSAGGMFGNRNPEVLVSSYMAVRPNTIYTMYIFNWNTSPDAIRTMIVEDRK